MVLKKCGQSIVESKETTKHLLGEILKNQFSLNKVYHGREFENIVVCIATQLRAKRKIGAVKLFNHVIRLSS